MDSKKKSRNLNNPTISSLSKKCEKRFVDNDPIKKSRWNSSTNVNHNKEISKLPGLKKEFPNIKSSNYNPTISSSPKKYEKRINDNEPIKKITPLMKNKLKRDSGASPSYNSKPKPRPNHLETISETPRNSLLKIIDGKKTEACNRVQVLEKEIQIRLLKNLVTDYEIPITPFTFKKLISMGDAKDFELKYECTSGQLGGGQSGSVFKGFRRSESVGDPPLPVAIKTISFVNKWGKIDGDDYDYPTEYCILNKLLDCNNVCQLLDAYYNEEEDQFILILEFVQDSCTLKDFMIEQGPLKESFIRTLFRKIVKAVEECHEKGVYHRDLKEDNILVVDVEQIPKLIDFDLSSLVEDSPYLDRPGTYEYMSPEMLGNAEYAGLATEVYAIGVILYDLLFDSIGWQKIIRKNDDKIYTSSPSDHCLDLLSTMLASRPEDRPSVKEILLHPWMNITGS